ncbi:hypothetical protein R0381_000205 [Jeongeupia wiesaeckerbachi]|uniref:hypothetical protein n=1 Tax=Jeongeupia wiesaeckerbachi TaxID=3051218 RepID=UPI003D803011
MLTRFTIHIIALLSTFAMVQASAEALKISGASDQAGWATALRTDSNSVLRFSIDGHAWQVSPWPTTLPRRLEKQFVEISTGMHPAGPIRRMTLRKPSSQQAWLELVAAGPFDHPLVPGWTLRNGTTLGADIVGPTSTPQEVKIGQSRILKDSNGYCWRFGLIATAIPAKRTEIASEREPRADWYLASAPHCR